MNTNDHFVLVPKQDYDKLIRVYNSFGIEMYNDTSVPTLDLTPGKSSFTHVLRLGTPNPDKHPFVSEVHIVLPNESRRIFKYSNCCSKEKIEERMQHSREYTL